MKNSDSDKLSHSEIKGHSEILQIIDEIRGYEKNFMDFSTEVVEEVPDVEHDLIEVSHETVIPEDDLSESEKKNFSLFKKEKESKPNVPTTFKIGFNEKGELVNLDLKQPKPKKENEKSKSKFNLKKLIPIKKKGEESAESSESSSKVSKLKGGLGKLSKLKKVIPNKNKSSNEETKK